MRRWLISVPVALAVLGVTGCLPGQVPVIVPVAVPSQLPSPSPSPSPSPTCLQVRTRLPERTDVSVTVYNGASRPGLANNVAEELTARGFKVLKVASADRPYPQTLLRHGPEGLGAAWLLRAYFLDARTDYVATQQGASVDVLLGASFVKVPTPPEVNQAIAQHGTPVPPPGTCPA
jgi:hypothetical protein